MPFLAQPSQFILVWDRHQICRLAHPVAEEEMIKRTSKAKLQPLSLYTAFSALTMVGWQEGHPACKNWCGGMLVQ